MAKHVIDATNLIVGRLASHAAKQAMLGEDIDIVNCEKSIFTGNKSQILAKYKARMAQGQPSQGPFLQRNADRFVRRIVRGMLPYKQPKGKVAFKKVMCYIGVPEEMKDKMETIESANIKKVKNMKYTSIGRICKLLGGKV